MRACGVRLPIRLEVLGHSVGGITYRHYAHRAALAFKAIMTIPQLTAFSALLNGHECVPPPPGPAPTPPMRRGSSRRW